MGELIGPNELNLSVRFHGTFQEINFVNWVIQDEIRRKYTGPISLVGSRAQGFWISTVRFNSSCAGLPDEERSHWFTLLNSLAKANRFYYKEIPLLVGDLPYDAPKEVFEFLETDKPGSDFDLRLQAERLPSGIDAVYYHSVTGIPVDVWSEGDEL